MKVQAHSSWLAHHWRRFVPAACVLLLLGAGLVHVVHLATHSVGVTDLYRQATAEACHDPDVIAALGKPITGSLRRVTGAESESSRTAQRRRIAYRLGGYAALTVELDGPKGVATLHIRATQASGHWHYQLLSIDTSHRQHIDLLHDMAASAGKHI